MFLVFYVGESNASYMYVESIHLFTRNMCMFYDEKQVQIITIRNR